MNELIHSFNIYSFFILFLHLSHAVLQSVCISGHAEDGRRLQHDGRWAGGWADAAHSGWPDQRQNRLPQQGRLMSLISEDVCSKRCTVECYCLFSLFLEMVVFREKGVSLKIHCGKWGWLANVLNNHQCYSFSHVSSWKYIIVCMAYCR